MKLHQLHKSTYEKDMQGFSIETVNHQNGEGTMGIVVTQDTNRIIRPQVELLKHNNNKLSIGSGLTLTKKELTETLDFYNDKLRKQVVLIPRRIIMKIINARMYRGNITLQTHPELKELFQDLSTRINKKVTDIVIQCIDDRNPNGKGESADFGPRIPGGAILWYAIATQMTARLLQTIVPHKDTYGVSYSQYEGLGGLAGHIGEGGDLAIDHGDLCKCGCGAVKGIINYINTNDHEGLGAMGKFILDLFKYNKQESLRKPNILPTYTGGHVGIGAVQFKHHVFDATRPNDAEFLPYGAKSEGVFFINKNIQRIFVMTEMLCLVNKILKYQQFHQKEKILNLFPGYDIDRKHHQIIINSKNRINLWNAVKNEFKYFDGLVLQQAAKNVKAIEEVLPKLLVM